VRPAAQLLVVAAHPDDETVGAASLLLRTERAAVVHVTDGSPADARLRPGHPDRAAYARLRRAEAEEALAVAGLDRGRILRLGGADQEVARSLAPLARELAAILAALRPRLVVAHAWEGGHPDHDASALATRAALALVARREGEAPRLVEMTGYHLAGARLATSEFLPGPRAVRHRLGPEERARKRAMLERYASQRAALAAFGVETEDFRLGGPLAPAARPHPGPLHYKLRGWTTFEELRAAAVEGLAALGLSPGRAGPTLAAGELAEGRHEEAGAAAAF
jgi:LmbE family N-acetylglucosaminyl deacetylase